MELNESGGNTFGGRQRIEGRNNSMKICMCRVDARLIHGQITAVWARELGASSIFVVDDELSEDRLTIKILCMTAPSKVDVHVLSVAQMVEVLHNRTMASPQIRAIILFRNLMSAKSLFDLTGKIYETLTLGGMPSRIGRYEIEKNLFLSKEERLVASDMMRQHGISIISQVLPSDAPIDVGALIQNVSDS